jgi:hypothetical protein
LVSPRGLAGGLAAVMALLVALHGLVQVARFASGDERLNGLVYIFSLGAEHNVPTLYSTVTLLFTAALLAAVAVHSRRDRAYWCVLALTFVFLAADEAFEIHEKLIVPLRSRFDTGGILFYAWVIPYGIATLLFSLVYLRFLLRLPRHTSVLFAVAGAVFISGAVGMEMISGLLRDQAGVDAVAYVLAQTAEETLEMSGVVLFIYAVADYLSRELGGISIRLGGSP